MALPGTLTVADLYAMPESERGERYELITGDLYVNPAPRPRHQLVNSNLLFHFSSHVRSRRLGWVVDNVGVHVGSLTYVIPDVAFISHEHFEVVGAANIEGAPDLVCEILSPSTRRQDLVTKRAFYARIGVREYWIIDPDALTVTVLVLEEGVFAELASAEPGVAVSRELPGLHLRLDEVFEDIDLIASEPEAQE